MAIQTRPRYDNAMRNVGSFHKDDLAVLHIGKPAGYDPADYFGEPWQSQMCAGMAELAAPNWEISDTELEVLITRVDIWNWRRAGQEMKAVINEVAVKPGHYGDSRWPGVDLVADPARPDHYQWIFCD